MKKFNFKKELYNDLKYANEKLSTLEKRLSDKEENLAEKREKIEYFKDNLGNYIDIVLERIEEDKVD